MSVTNKKLMYLGFVLIALAIICLGLQMFLYPDAFMCKITPSSLSPNYCRNSQILDYVFRGFCLLGISSLLAHQKSTKK
jgi:hypothetical protein